MFQKKFLLFVATLLTFCSAFLSGQRMTAKADELDAQDQCFLEFIAEDTGSSQITYSHVTLYDATLQENGRQYVFTVGEVPGYALISRVVMDGEAFYEVEELFYNKPAPFVGVQGLPVYITFNAYLDCVDGVFYNLADNRSVVSSETIAEMQSKGFGYRGNNNGDITTTTETVTYSTKSTDEYRFPFYAPNISGGLSGSCCANTAGAVVIAYYDRFKENLIPNFQSYILMGGAVVIYKNTAAEYEPLIYTLVDYMAVEGIQQGTTFTGFQNGMERYVEEKGYSYSTSSVMSWGNFDFDEYVDAVEQEKPVALFLNGFSMYHGITTETEGQDVIESGYCAATHVEVGIGYRVDTYYNANGTVKTTRKYLRVISGLDSYGMGYLNINASGEIVNAVSINIT